MNIFPFTFALSDRSQVNDSLPNRRPESESVCSKRSAFIRTLLASLFSLILGTTSAHASFHLWQITQIYSNASGSVQFIDLFTTASGQNVLAGQSIMSNGHSFTFPTNLVGNTANHFFLIATPGYVAIPGAPAPDYVLPTNNWFSLTNDTINYANVNSLTFTAGQLPTDGVNSLNRIYNPPTSTTFFIAPNSPTDFAGNTGSVPEPSVTALSIAAVGLAVFGFRWRARVRRLCPRPADQ